MKKESKIFYSVILLIVIVLVTVCAVGLTLGGVFAIWHLIIFVIIDLSVGFATMLFIRGKEKIKSRGTLELVFLISAILFCSSMLLYGGINSFTATDENMRIYDTVYEFDFSRRELFTTITFKNPEGNICDTKDYAGLLDDYLIGGNKITITVEERAGGFGYPVYTITEVKGSEINPYE